MFLKNYWYVAAWDHEVGREPTARMILGEPIVMYRTEDGRAVAFEDRCCHRRAPLSFGRVTGDNLQCGYHGMVYGPDGKVIAIPGQTQIPPGSAVRTYPLVERWQFLWIWMGDPAEADESEIPELHWHDDPDWTYVGGYLQVDAHYQLLVDNLLDLTHETFLHASTIGNEHVANTPLAKVERDTLEGVKGTALERVSRDLPSASEIVKPDHASVANAIGAAIAQVGGEVDRVFSLEGLGRDAALDQAKQEATDKAVEAGAVADTVQIVDIEEVPLAGAEGLHR